MSANRPGWRTISDTRLGIVSLISQYIGALMQEHPMLRPVLSPAGRLLCASDFSGEHRAADFTTLSFLLADEASASTWERKRRGLRTGPLANREMSYKDLRDGVRRNALVQYFDAADELNGLLLTFCIHERAQVHLRTSPVPTPERWPDAVFHKANQVVQLMGMMVACLSAPGQSVTWLIDQDAIAENDTRKAALLSVIDQTWSALLPHALGEVHFNTLIADDATMTFRDLASLCDLAAGAACDWLTEHGVREPSQTKQKAVDLAPLIRPTSWDVPLKRITLVLSWSNTHGKYLLTSLFIGPNWREAGVEPSGAMDIEEWLAELADRE